VKRLVPIAFALGLSAAACGPSLRLVSPAPPSRVIHFEPELFSERIELTEGIAVAFTCHRWTGPCQDLKLAVLDPRIARVFHAEMAELDQASFDRGNVSSLALAGVRPGETTLVVWAEGYTTRYAVKVLPVEPEGGAPKGAR
jgi:hypothetical protein